MGCGCNKYKTDQVYQSVDPIKQEQEDNLNLFTQASRSEKQSKQSNQSEQQNQEDLEKDLDNLGSDSLEQIEHYEQKLFKKVKVFQGNSEEMQANLDLLESNADINDNYQIQTLIGRGSRGQLKVAKHKLSKELRVVKIIRKKAVTDLKDFLREITALYHISHPNILHFYELFQDEKQFYLIFEYCKGGDLLEKIVINQCLSEQSTAIIIQQILSVLKYLHNKKLLHKALRCESVLIKSQFSMREVKICDISMAFKNQFFNELQDYPQYTAPEVLKNKKFSEKSDV